MPLTLMDGSEFPARDLTIFLAAAVIILSLTAGSLLLPFLLRGLDSPTESVPDDEIDLARAEAAKAAIRAVEEATHELAAGHSDADLYADAASRVMDLYRRRLEGHAAGENSAHIRLGETIERKLHLAAIRAERETIFALARRNEIADDKSRALVREIDLLKEKSGEDGRSALSVHRDPSRSLLVVGSYINTVRLLLAVAPAVFRSRRFAMKGGTALNLFVQTFRGCPATLTLSSLTTRLVAKKP